MSDSSGGAWFVKQDGPVGTRYLPVRWQGWLTLLAYLVVLLAMWLPLTGMRPRGLHGLATLAVVAGSLVATAVFIVVAVVKSHPAADWEEEQDMLPQDLATHFRPEPGYWFVPHMFGIGATPVTWQGWALSIGFAALLVLDMRFMPERIAQIGIAIALVILFTVTAIRKTRGGWGWHWGVRK